MQLTSDQKKFKQNLWIIGRLMYQGNLRAQALYVLFGLQKLCPEMYQEMLRDVEFFPEFAGQLIETKDEYRLLSENQSNWGKAFS